MAERYRDLVRPALVDLSARTTPSGGDQAAESLAAALSSFSRQTGSLAATFAAQEGARQGAEAGATDDPEFRQGLRSLSAFGRAYNDAALRSYAIRAEKDLNETAARLEAEAGTNPEAFREAMDDVRKSVLEEAPLEARSTLDGLYTQRMGAGLARIQTALTAEIRAEDRELVNEQIGNLTEATAYLRAQDEPEAYKQSLIEEGKLVSLLDGALADGTISKAEHRTAIRKAQKGIIRETVVARFRNELSSPYGDPIGFIEDLKEANRTEQSLTPEEEQQLEGLLFAELREHNALRSARRAEDDAAAVMAEEEADRFYTGKMLAGDLTTRELYDGVTAGNLAPAVARTLNNELQSGAGVVSDQERLFRYETNLLSYTEEDIARDTSLSWSDRSRLIQKLQTEKTTWKGTQKAREAFDRIDRALGILPGSDPDRMSEAELRQRDEALTQLYDAVDALPPEEREAALFTEADRVIKTVIRERAGQEKTEWERRLTELEQTDTSNFDEREMRIHQQAVERASNIIRELDAKQQATQ